MSSVNSANSTSYGDDSAAGAAAGSRGRGGTRFVAAGRVRPSSAPSSRQLRGPANDRRLELGRCLPGRPAEGLLVIPSRRRTA